MGKFLPTPEELRQSPEVDSVPVGQEGPTG